MNLIIDIGNTRIKVAIFNKDELIFITSLSEISIIFLEQLFGRFPIEKSIISSTGKLDNSILEWLKSMSLFIFLNKDTSLPFKNNYLTKDSLGYDRIAGVAGALSLFPAQSCLIIDCGTAITFDFVDNNATYFGGNISPGIEMRFKALHTFTQKLPLIEKFLDFSMIGNSTESAIRNGVIRGVLYELNGYINEFCEVYDHLQIILTGGDADFLANKLKYTIFVDENLVLEGLNRILEYNVSK
jgi:type III pantothenate kinase